MVNAGFVPDVVTWTTLIGGFCRVGRPLAAKELFFSTNMARCPISRLVLLYWMVYLLFEATSLFELMEKSGLDLNIVIYNIMLDGMWATGEVNGA
ncbi:hypothetical protein Ahy_B04g069144 [Arachis hypogaea]|uniref:Pentatricopeptide repeat-containing protein n=1 Tax=Arachis hypogaea TaxID=3818 RepID=A0A444ZBU1_ARAHY|nr:hypothetical protein Ahy_B04g069144 [Arachis hypogaea]